MQSLLHRMHLANTSEVMRVRTGGKTSLKNDGDRGRRFRSSTSPCTPIAWPMGLPGGRAGYPQYSNDSGPEVGYYNLAVFFEACNFNCLYCQNWSFKKKQLSPRWSKVATIEEAVKPDTSCICFFGGDPGPQLPFALRLSGSVRKKNPEKILRICWETNGAMNRPAKKWRVSHAVGRVCTRSTSSMETGNHRDICGWENRQVLDNSKGGRMGLRAPPTRRCCRQHAACTRYFERNEIWGWQIYRPDKPRLPLRPSRLSPRSFYG